MNLARHDLEVDALEDLVVFHLGVQVEYGQHDGLSGSSLLVHTSFIGLRAASCRAIRSSCAVLSHPRRPAGCPYPRAVAAWPAGRQWPGPSRARRGCRWLAHRASNDPAADQHVVEQFPVWLVREHDLERSPPGTHTTSDLCSEAGPLVCFVCWPSGAHATGLAIYSGSFSSPVCVCTRTAWSV